MKHTVTIFIALFVMVLAIASCQPNNVKLPPEPGTFIGPIGKAGVYPAWASPGANKFMIDHTNIAIQKNKIEFTLGGSVSDVIASGEIKTYILTNISYEVTVLSFSTELSNWEITLSVNGETTDPLGIGESYTLTDNTTISIDDIFPGTPSSMAELKASDDFIWHKFYTLDNTNQWVEHTATCSLFPSSTWCANLATSDIDIDLETYFDGQNYAVGYTCSILQNNQFDCSGNRWKLIWFNVTEGTN